MKNKVKIICFDIDGVICATKKNDYKNSKPIKQNINCINKLFKDYKIKIFTSRFMGRNKENPKKARAEGLNFTIKQLKSWNVNYDELIFGKPSYDLFVDDKNFNFSKDWSKNIKL